MARPTRPCRHNTLEFQQGDPSKVRADHVSRIADVLAHLDGDAFDVDLVDYH